ncbi:MAG: lipoyl(octanoyl) transferase LipB [Neisseriaceae bacterium]|nr:lipoyl(octanoyl) transferase LipB [Neisseriaceae bacterium]
MKIKYLGRNQPYLPIFRQMQDFTANRTPDTQDELWVVEHAPVFTQGKAGRAEHLLYANDIPVIETDRGGQITYHGLGQVVVYVLIDFKRRNISVRELVSRIENAVIATLSDYHIQAAADPKRPGVYTPNGKKIASLGLRIKNGATYHGVALNVNMDLSPFSQINPCGYAGLQMTQVADFIQPCPDWQEVAEKLAQALANRLE